MCIPTIGAVTAGYYKQCPALLKTDAADGAAVLVDSAHALAMNRSHHILFCCAKHGCFLFLDKQHLLLRSKPEPLCALPQGVTASLHR